MTITSFNSFMELKTKEKFLVSVIIPCRNEEKFISACLNSLLEQDFPKERLEILVVNGASSDKTSEIVEEYAKKYRFIKLLQNTKKFTPFGLNLGIGSAQGEVIVRLDAHASYSKDYILKCVNHLLESGAQNVGGVVKTKPAQNTLSARAIAHSLSHFFGAASAFRLQVKKPQETDTVFGGCYPKEIFSKIGYFNEKLIRSQDLEFNLRLKRAGGKIMIFPDIVSYYYPSATLDGFFRHNFQDGIWVILPLKFGLAAFSLRHLLPLFFVLSLALSFFLSPFVGFLSFIFLILFYPYLFLTLLFSLQIAWREKSLGLLAFMPLAFILRHFGYGLGSVYGLVKLLKD